MRCYMPAIVMLMWALLVVAGLDAQVSLVPFLVAEAAAIATHVREMKSRLQHLRDTDHWW
jgi:hypothetical protein